MKSLPRYRWCHPKGITRVCAIELFQEQRHHSCSTPYIYRDEVVLASNKTVPLQEVFGTGTAAVVSPVSLIGYKEEKLIDPSKYTIVSWSSDTINKLRTQDVPDIFHWLEELV